MGYFGTIDIEKRPHDGTRAKVTNGTSRIKQKCFALALSCNSQQPKANLRVLASHAFYFNERSPWKSLHFHHCTGRFVAGEKLLIETVEGGKLSDIYQENIDGNDIDKSKSCCLQDLTNVLQGLHHLLNQSLTGELTACRHKADLATHKKPPVCPDCLGVWPDCSGGPVRLYNEMSHFNPPRVF
jgi:hypothetical protein